MELGTPSADANQVHVTENGQPVSGLTLEPLSQAGSKDFGVIVVVDESSSLSPNSRAQELAAVDAIAGRRTGQQQFGVIAYSAAPATMVPLTSNPTLIGDALKSAPLVAPGGSLLPALSMAYGQLHRAGLAAGAVIVVTAGKDLANPSSEAASSQIGLRMGYQTFTTDILADTGAGTARSHSSDGDNDAAQEAALGAQLTNAADIWSRLNSGYLASYRSAARAGQTVTVSVSVTGLTGTPTMTYTASRPAVSSDPGRAVAEPVAHPLPAAELLPVRARGGSDRSRARYLVLLDFPALAGHGLANLRVATGGGVLADGGRCGTQRAGIPRVQLHPRSPGRGGEVSRLAPR